MKILIVDDHIDNRALLRAMLDNQGFSVEEAVNGVQALELARAAPPDLIISDILMPEIDGFTLCRVIKGIELLCHIPFIFYTAAYLDKEYEKLGLALGASRYICKPLEAVEFLGIIDEVIDAHDKSKLQTPEILRDVSTNFKTLHQEKLAQRLDKMLHNEDKQSQEQALQKSEEQYRALYDNAPLSYQSLDREGCIIDVNPAWLATLGYDRQEVIGKSFGDFLYPESKLFFKKKFPQFKQQAGVHGVEFQIRHKDGHYLYVSFEGRIGYTSDGRVKQTYCVFQDTTQRKQAEIALQESEKKFRTLVTHSEEIIYMLDKEGIFLLSEGKGLAKLGLQPGQVVGESVFELYKDYPHMLNEIRKVFNGETISIEVFIQGHYFRSWYTPHKNNNGDIIGLLGMSVNITEQRHMELALRDSEARFRAIYEYAPVLINAFDENGCCLLWNKQCCETFGWTIDEINAQDDALSLFYPDPAVRDQVLRTVTSDPDGEFREWHPLTKNGKTLTTMWANFRLHDGIAFSLGYDITARKQAEEALRESEARFRTLFKYAPDAMFLNNREGIFIDCNQQAEKLSGLSCGEMIGQYFIRPGIFPKKNLHQILKIVARARAGQATGTDEMRLNQRSGKSIDAEINSIPVVVNGSHQILTIVHDITARKKAEKVLREKEEKFRVITTSALDAIIMLDSAGRIKLWNSAAEKMFGYQASEVEGQLLNELIIPERYREAHSRGIMHFNETGQSDKTGTIVETEALRADGTEFPVELSVSGVNQAGEWLTISFIRDITERKCSETELKEQLNELHRWHEVIVDREGRGMELKAEVNALLAELGRLPRYSSVKDNGDSYD